MASSYTSPYPYLLIAVFGIASVSFALQEDVTENKKAIVLTKNGYLRGEVLNDNLYRFSGIPFAEPPIGNLRFEPPVKKGLWVGILNATKHRSTCIQGTAPFHGMEDCLFLKIYTPKAPNATNRLPVIVWIHGGAFYNGEPDFDDAHPEFLLREGVIVATLHYRVGLFGFISTEDSVVPGNLGLKDQIMALEWIKDNVENFGGDPAKITLLGQSAGSGSIAYLLQAPQTKGLYSAAIMLSGSSLDTWTLTRNPLKFAKSVAKNLMISTESNEEMIKGLKNLSAKEIQNATSSQFTSELINNPLGGLPLGPVAEPQHPGAVITGKSHDLLKRGLFNEVPILMGHTSLEAHSEDGLNIAIRMLVTEFDLNPSRLVPISLKITNPVERILLGEKIKLHYFGLIPMPLDDLNFLRWISEDQFVRGVHEAVKLYSQKVPVYFYNFAYEGNLAGVQNRTVPGVGHTEDLYYLFDFGGEGSETDYLVRNRVVRLITNFAKHRNPTPTNDDLLENFKWPANFKVSDSEIKQVNITDEFKIVRNPNSHNMVFWKNVFDKHGQFGLDTY